MTEPDPPSDPFAPPGGDVPAATPPAPAAWEAPPVPAWAHPQLGQQPPTWQQGGWPQGEWPQGEWPQPAGWSGIAPPRKTNGLAIAALVTGVMALVPIAIGLGIAALVQIRRRHEAGTGLAVGGLVASGVWVLLGGLVALAILSEGFSYTRDGDLSDIASHEVGTCLIESPPSVTDCSTPHDLEVYYTARLPEPSWPGKNEVDSAADDVCYDTFEGYVGTSYEDSEYDYSFYAPSKAEWTAGSHQVVCVVLPPGRYLTGSVKSSGR